MEPTWSILPDQAERSFGVRIETPNADDAWPHFFTGLSIDKYPAIIELLAEETGYDSNGTGVNFPQDLAQLDPTGPALPADHVEVYVPGFEESIIPRSLFYSALLAFSSYLLERPGRPGPWYTDLRAALQKLRTKMVNSTPS